MRNLKPAEITTIYLLFLYVTAVVIRGSSVFIFGEVVRLGILFATFVVPTVLLLVYRGRRPGWDNILITLLLLLLLADPNTSPTIMIALGAITFFFKLFIRVQGHPFFNPAALSLALLSFAGLVTSWWGVSYAPRFTPLGISAAVLFTLPIGVYIIWKYKKVPTLISTTGVLLAVSYVLSGTVPTQLLLEGTYAFFLLIMATEPKTTPVVDAQEWVYGSVLGGSLALWFYFNAPLPYLLNLLILNALFSFYKVFVIEITQIRSLRQVSTTS